MEQTLRIPRPIGTTQLGYLYHQEPTKDNKNKLRTNLIRNYIHQALYFPYPIQGLKASTSVISTKNKKLNNKNKTTKTYSHITTRDNTIEYELRAIQFEDLALYLSCSVIRLENRIHKILGKEARNNQKQVSQIDYSGLARATNFRVLKKSLQGLERAEDWAKELQQVARGNGYRPGNILAANQAMSNEVSWLKQIEGSVKALNPTTSGTIPGYQKNTQINNYGTQDPHNPDLIGSQILTPTMAIKMLEDQGISRQPLDLDLIGLEHGIHGPDMPSVEAISSDAQGSRAFNPKDLIQLAHESAPKITHENRRTEEYGDIEEVE